MASIVHDAERLAEFVKTRRLALGLSQEELALRLGVTRTWVRNLERDPLNVRKRPARKYGTAQVLLALKELGVTLVAVENETWKHPEREWRPLPGGKFEAKDAPPRHSNGTTSHILISE